MRRVKRFSAPDVLPPRDDVLRRMEMPEDAPVSETLEGLIASAQRRFLEIADPLGVAELISQSEFRAVYAGEGRNATRTPLDDIARGAERLALFVATLGQAISDEISRAFVSGDPAFGLVLDACASEGANRLAYRVGADVRQALRARESLTVHAVVLPYCPGYCGWHVSGQRALFAAINADTIGVSLGKSCLMSPMKSVSGVLVAGPAAIHRFRPAYAFCDECATRDCIARMASVPLS